MKTNSKWKAAWWTAKLTLTLTSINYESQWHNIAARGLLFSIEAGAVAASWRYHESTLHAPFSLLRYLQDTDSVVTTTFPRFVCRLYMFLPLHHPTRPFVHVLAPFPISHSFARVHFRAERFLTDCSARVFINQFGKASIESWMILARKIIRLSGIGTEICVHADVTMIPVDR